MTGKAEACGISAVASASHVLKVITVQALDYEALLLAHPDVMINHVLSQGHTIDEHDTLITEATGVIVGFLSEAAGRDEHALPGLLTPQATDERLYVRSGNPVIACFAFRLHEDLRQAKAVLVDDSVHPTVATLAEGVTCAGATAAVTQGQ